MSLTNKNFRILFVTAVILLVVTLLWLSISALAQTAPQTETTKTDDRKAAQQTVLQPVLTEYKGIKIGMTAQEVRDKFDKKPKIDDKDGFYYVFSDEEAAQIRLDKNKRVRLIAVTYSGGDAPKYEDVFGTDVPLKEGENGKIYKMMRYPQAGYWVAYSRTAGDKPVITVTMQKMRGAK